MATSVTMDELKWFHSIDRDIFTVLVINLRHDIAVSKRVIGLWLWLEEKGYPNIILPMLSSTDAIVDSVAREAVLCLNCIDKHKLSPAATSSNEIPSTRRLMRRDISLSFFSDNRVSAVRSISRFVSEIGSKTFNDIVEKVVKHRPNGSSSERRWTGVRHVVPTSSDHLKKGKASSGTSPDGRTIFVTFSRGYPVSESEIRDFFNMNYGGCLESIYMQEVSSPNVQSMFARVVLRSYAAMAFILEGVEDDKKVKLWINGKQARARKYC